MLMSFDYSQTPTEELNVRRVMNPSYIDLVSVEYIVSNTRIAEAWKKVRANKGAPGVDKISIEQFPKWGRPKWKLIKNQVETGSYQPTPARRVEIPKESGGIRLLGIPCVLDRVFMQSIAKVLSDLFNPTFSQQSYGYMPGRSVQQAALQAQKFYQQGFIYQVDIDLEQFFDTVNHDVLMDRIRPSDEESGLAETSGSLSACRRCCQWTTTTDPAWCTARQSGLSNIE